MGYPMTYSRVVARNDLSGDYSASAPTCTTCKTLKHPSSWTNEEAIEVGKGMIRGDLRRLETDQRDERHLEEYARRADVTVEQARAVLDAFFEGQF